MFFQDIYDVTYCLWSHMSCGQLINVTANRWLISLNLVTCHRETVLTENLYIFISFLFIYYIYFARVTFSSFYFVSNGIL